MNNLAGSDSVDMSCPLLNKLAPETITLIYEHVLSFEMPVKHATNMQPFLRKLTGVEGVEDEDNSDLQSTRAEPESSLSANARGNEKSLQHVNTSILTTSKLIYTEAIAVLYERNIISIHAGFCDYKALKSPLATDLSLATQIVSKIDMLDDQDAAKTAESIGPFLSNALLVATMGLPAIFPNSHSSNVYVYVSSRIIFDIAAMLRSLPGCRTLSFDGVGSMVASIHHYPYLNFIVQCEAIMERWATKTEDHSTRPLHPIQFTAIQFTANSLYRASRADPVGIFAIYARKLFLASRTHVSILPANYGAIEQDNHEFWTLIDICLDLTQSLLMRLS